MSQLQRQLRICHVQWRAANALPMPCNTVCRTNPHIVVMLPYTMAGRKCLCLQYCLLPRTFALLLLHRCHVSVTHPT